MGDSSYLWDILPLDLSSKASPFLFLLFVPCQIFFGKYQPNIQKQDGFLAVCFFTIISGAACESWCCDRCNSGQRQIFIMMLKGCREA